MWALLVKLRFESDEPDIPVKSRFGLTEAADKRPHSTTRTSECPTCPDWVIRCAHFGNETLRLADFSIEGARCPCVELPFIKAITVQVAFEIIRQSLTRPCPMSDEPAHSHSRMSDRAYAGYNLGEAVAAFYKAEEELRHAE